MRTFPKWATPERRAWLAYKLANYISRDTGGFEVDLLTGSISHPDYERLQAGLKAEWVADDRDARAYLRRLERHKLHPIEYIRQGGFDSTSREVFLEGQPSHYAMGQTIDVLRQQPVALVRVSSTPVQLWVDIPTPSKHALRKARRYGKVLQTAIDTAVADWRTSPA